MDQETLLEKQRYPRLGSVVFLRVNEPNGKLSNMNGKFPLTVNGIRIRTSEALYQACRFPDYPEVQRLIIDAKSPMAAKMASKPHRKDKLRADWERVHVDVMRWCLRVKLAQNFDAFGEELSNTGKKPIVEESSKRDGYWGTIPQDDGLLVGSNVLGKLLMELRAEFNVPGDKNWLKTVQPLSIPNFRLMGEAIGVVG